nr:diguanylate cyclase [Bowmanella dokdonensis]
MAANAMERNTYPLAQERLQQALAIFQEQGERKLLADAYRQMGRSYRYQSNYQPALDYVYLAMQIYQQLQDKAAISDAHSNIGVILEKMGQYQEAILAHQKALELFHELNDAEGIATTIFNLGDIHRVLGDHQTALDYFQDALRRDLEAGTPKEIAYSHNKLAYQYSTLGNFELAREHIEKAIRLFEQIQAPRDLDWAMTTLARLELESGNLSSARQILEGVIQRARENLYLSLLVDAYRMAAEVALKQEDSAGALTYIDAGVIQARENVERHDEALLESLRVQAHLQQDAMKEAFQALERQKQLDDALLDEKRMSTIATVQAQTENIRREQQIELLKKEQALQQAKLEQQRLSRNLWITGLLACFIILFMFYKRISQRRLNANLTREVARQTDQLQKQNAELERAYLKMEAISLTDKLTGLNNRRFLESHIEADMEHCRRLYQDWHTGKAERPHNADLVVFLLDMDNFKGLNDQHGHLAGDAVLKQLSQRMEQVFRHSDFLVRWGGEEFVAVARFISRSDARQLAERLRQTIQDGPFALGNGQTQQQTASIGYVCYPLDVETDGRATWQTLMGLADTCLYAAKQSGRNQWIGIESLRQEPGNLQTLQTQSLPQWYAQGRVELGCSLTDPEQIQWSNP